MMHVFDSAFFNGDLFVAMWILGVFNDLIVFMPFSCKDDDISGFRHFNGMLDGFCPVPDQCILTMLHPFFQIFKDTVIFLISWIIGRQDHIVRNGCFFCHCRTLRLIAVSTCTDKENDLVFLERHDGLDCFFNGIRCMGVVDVDR